MVQVTPEEEQQRTHFWMIEEKPTFQVADPPADLGEARFEVEFNIDGYKRLLNTARDLLTYQFTHKDFPVVRLS